LRAWTDDTEADPVDQADARSLVARLAQKPVSLHTDKKAGDLMNSMGER
jgi:hypothetical protein